MAKGINWEHIKSEYEDSNKSVRAIAKENNITHGAIQRRAKKEEWKKLDDNLIKDKYLMESASFMDKISIRKVKEIMSELGENYSPLDEPLVVAYAVNYSKWIKLQNELNQEGTVITSPKGGKYLNPVFNATKSVEKTILSIANQLGLTMSSRKKLDLSLKDENEKGSIFNLTNLTEEEINIMCNIDV